MQERAGQRGSATSRDRDPPPWIFGYGSLIWRPDFAFTDAVPAWLPGYQRRFWQRSPDHRGTPDAPGRVVTLLPARGARVFGVAYRPVAAERARILEALDHREKAGYQRQVVELHPHRASTRSLPSSSPPPSLTALVYIATEDNENFTGPQPAAEIATLLATRSGPSGPNIEYFARLRAALAEHGVIDPHIEQLAAALHG